MVKQLNNMFCCNILFFFFAVFMDFVLIRFSMNCSKLELRIPCVVYTPSQQSSHLPVTPWQSLLCWPRHSQLQSAIDSDRGNSQVAQRNADLPFHVPLNFLLSIIVEFGMKINKIQLSLMSQESDHLFTLHGWCLSVQMFSSTNYLVNHNWKDDNSIFVYFFKQNTVILTK